MILMMTRRFRGPVRFGLVPLAAIALITACSASYFVSMRKAQLIGEGLPRAAVRRVSFDACLTASGAVQCPQKTVVKCRLENLRVRSRGSTSFLGGASTILEIIPNGSTVKKGDVLCRLDAWEYEEMADAQAFRVAQHLAEKVQTDQALQAAEIALREYREGLVRQDTQGMQVRVALAESQMKAASDRLAWTERVAALGYASKMQLANDRAALLSTTNQLRQARMEFDIYRDYRAPKTIFSLQADVEKARVWFIHEADDYRKAQELLARYRDLIERCTIRAPQDGLVIYANGPFRDESDRSVIELGASVRQDQELFYIPDLSRMEVVAMLHDTAVNRIRTGMPARIRVEGLREVSLKGRVESVGEIPKMSISDVPYYSCLITLDVTPSGLLPGMSAEVEVQAGLCRDVLAVPTEAVSVDHGRNLCYIIGPSGLEHREITPGLSTPQLIEVTDGLEEGESVVLNPSRVFGGSPLRADSAGTDQPDTLALAAAPLIHSGAAPGPGQGGRTSDDRVASP
jgi:HlyD family secretion protein